MSQVKPELGKLVVRVLNRKGAGEGYVLIGGDESWTAAEDPVVR